MRKMAILFLAVGLAIWGSVGVTAGADVPVSKMFSPSTSHSPTRNTGGVLSAESPSVQAMSQNVNYNENRIKNIEKNRENQSEIPRRITDLQALALSRSPAVAVLDQRIESARGAALQAGLPANPTLGYDSEEIGAGGRAGKHGVVVSQEIMTGGKRTNAQNAGQWGVESLVCQRESISQGVANEVRLLACRVLAARQLVSVRNHLKTLVDSTERQAYEFRQAKEISEMDYLQLTVQARQAGLAVVVAENAQAAAERELLAVIGDEMGSLGPISDSLTDVLNRDEPDEMALLDRILAQSPEIREAEMVIRQRQAVVVLERSKAKSNITVGGGVYYDAEDERSIAAASLSIPIRVYDKNQGNIVQSQAEYGVAVRDLECLRLSIRQKCARVFHEYITARRESIVYRDDILPSLKKAYEMNSQAFQQGQIGFLEISASQISYLEASAQYIESLKRLGTAAALLDGMLIENNP